MRKESMSARKTTAPLSEVDDLKTSPTHMSRGDYALSREFRKYMVEWAGQDEVRWRKLAILSLRELGGWTHEMIAVLFGQYRGQISRLLESVKAELYEGFLHRFIDHETDCYIAIRVIDAETILRYLNEHRSLPEELADAREMLEDQIRRYAEE